MKDIIGRPYAVRSRQFTINSDSRILPTAYCLLKNCPLRTAYCALPTYYLLTNAQTYPIQATPQLIPPYSPKLSDDQTTSSEKLFVNILLTDTQDSGRQVWLKIHIEGKGTQHPDTRICGRCHAHISASIIYWASPHNSTISPCPMVAMIFILMSTGGII